MSIVPAEHYQPARNQNAALQRLTASREEIILLSHLLQASLVVERNNPARQIITAHPRLVRSALVVLVILLSVAIGLLAPQMSHALGM